MRNSIRAGVMVLAGAFALGCSPAKTKAPVETTTAEGKSTSPAGTAAEKRGTTLVRVVNALPRKGRIDIVADDKVLFSNIEYQDVSDFSELKANVARFTIKPNGRDTVLADNTEVMGDGARYTLVAIPDGEGGTKLRVLRDELVSDSTKTKIRVINAAPGMESIKVMLEGKQDPLFEDIALGTEAGYKDIEPADATLVFQAKAGTPKVRIVGVKLEAGRAYTIVLTGATSKKLEAVKFDDKLVRSAAQVSQRK